MNKTEAKTIHFKGIERVNERVNTNDGACEEIVNIRPQGNTWQNVGVRQQTTKKGFISIGNDEYRVIVHPVNADKYVLIWKDNKLILFDRDTEAKIRDFAMQGKIISVTYLENVLTICTDKYKYFYLWDEIKKEYTQIDTSNLVANVTARSYAMALNIEAKGQNGGFSEDVGSTKTDTHKEFFDYDFGKGNKLFPIKKRENEKVTSTTNYDNISLASRATLGYMEEELRKITQEYGIAKDITDLHKKKLRVTIKDTFKGLSFYRVAFKMYDGNYLNYSNIAYADTNGDDMFTFSSCTNNFPITLAIRTELLTSKGKEADLYTDHLAMFNPFGNHIITIDLSKTFDNIKNLIEKDIIKSIDLFMTRPIFSVNFDKDVKILSSEYKNGEQHGGSGLDDNNYYYSYGKIYGEFPRNYDGIKEQLTQGTYYRVKSFDREEITNNDNGIFYFATKQEDIASLEANETLPTPTTDNKVLFKNAYNYNQKQHLWNLVYQIFKGYDLPNDTGENEDTMFRQIYGNIIDDTKNLYYVVKGEYNKESFVIKHKINNPDRFIKKGSSPAEFEFPFFSFPTIDKITFGLYILSEKPLNESTNEYVLWEKEFNNICAGQNTNFICNLLSKSEEHFNIDLNKDLIYLKYTSDNYNTGHNFSCKKNRTLHSHFLPVSFLLLPAKETLLTERFVEKKNTKSTNILQLTETNNPFILPNSENYSFGEKNNEIIAIASNSGLVSERNFGIYPLYVFCKDGIYTMAVGNGDIAYSSIIKINNIQIINPNVLTIPSGIVFLSETGLSIINGRAINVLSNLVKGNPTVTNTDNINHLKRLTPQIKRLDLATNKLIDDYQLEKILNISYLTPISDNFLSEIKDSQMYFDQQHNEVCIVVKNKYTYVLNLDLLVFYKRSDYYQVDNVNTLSLSSPYIFDSAISDGIYHTYKGATIKYSNIRLFSIKETYNDSDICKSIVLITKPFALETRQYKIIDRIIFNLAYKDEDDFCLVIFGSRDGVNYRIVKKIMHIPTTNGRYYQDVFMEMITAQFKFATIWICGRKFTNTRIANASFQFKQTRISGIR